LYLGRHSGWVFTAEVAISVLDDFELAFYYIAKQ
jgi:hypothetical protein